MVKFYLNSHLLILVLVLSFGAMPISQKKLKKLDVSSSKQVKPVENFFEDLDKEFQSGKYPGINSVLVIKNDQLLFEKYANNFDAEKTHSLKSAGKSITSILVGIAIDKGFIKSINEKVIDYFPQYRKLKNFDKRKESITIRHLLTMTTGLECNDNFSSHKCINDVFFADDPFKAFFELNSGATPGKVWFYNDANVLMINRIIEISSKMSIQDFQKKYLDSILDIKGNFVSIEMKPRDIAKIGMLMSKKGKWGEIQVVSEEWVNESTRTHYLVDNTPAGANYGYFWWQKDFMVNDNVYKCFYAYGNGGQFIFVFPEQSVCVIFTGQNYNKYFLMNQPFRIIESYILKAVKNF